MLPLRLLFQFTPTPILSLQTIFFDTEFSGLQQNGYLLSLALVPEQGPWFYAVFTDADTSSLSAWHQEHVVPHLELTDQQLAALPSGIYLRDSKVNIVTSLREYLATFDKVVMWADVPAYDWVLFCALFGGAFGLPKHIHYMVRDLATLLEAKGYDIDTDRFALAYGGAPIAIGADAVVRSGDGRVGDLTPGPPPVERGEEGLLRHNALGDALAGKICWEKMMGR